MQEIESRSLDEVIRKAQLKRLIRSASRGASLGLVYIQVLPTSLSLATISSLELCSTQGLFASLWGVLERLENCRLSCLVFKNPEIHDYCLQACPPIQQLQQLVSFAHTLLMLWKQVTTYPGSCCWFPIRRSKH